MHANSPLGSSAGILAIFNLSQLFAQIADSSGHGMNDFESEGRILVNPPEEVFPIHREDARFAHRASPCLADFFLEDRHLTEEVAFSADVELQLEYLQDIIDSIDSVMGDPNTLFDAVSAYDSVHGPGAAFATNAKWALFSAFYDAATTVCADVLDAKYTEGVTPGDNPKALAGAEAFNFSNCEAYFVARRLGVVNID